MPICGCGECPGNVQSRFDFSADVVHVKFERYSCVICYSNVGYESVVECDIRVDAVFTVVWC